MSVCQHEDCEREAVAQWNGCVFCDEHVRERIAQLEGALTEIKHIGPLGVDTYPECYRRIQIVARAALAAGKDKP